MVSLACRSHGDHRSVAASLQRRASAFEPRLSHAERVCGSTAKRSVPSCNGPGRCGVWAFAPWPVAQPALQGAHTGGKGRRLKLAVVRRIWASHRALRRSAGDDLPQKKRSRVGEARWRHWRDLKNLKHCEPPHIGATKYRQSSTRGRGDANAVLDNRHRDRDWPNLVVRRDVKLGPCGRLGIRPRYRTYYIGGPFSGRRDGCVRANFMAPVVVG